MISVLLKTFGRIMLWRLRRRGLKVGKDSQILSFRFGTEPYLITIGDHVSVASGVQFITHDGATWVFRREARYEHVIRYGRITVKDNCLIGLGSIILPGVTIGPNAVVGAGAVVTSTVPENSIVAGNPARVIGKVSDYAEWCLGLTPKYDIEHYKVNKRAEVERHYT